MKRLKAGILFIGLGTALAVGVPDASAQEAAAEEAAAPQEPDGQALYDEHCKKCHGPAGGEPPAAMVKKMENLESVTDPAFLAETPEDSLISVTENGRGKMKPFAEKLTREEIIAIVSFLRTFEAAQDSASAPDR